MAMSLDDLIYELQQLQAQYEDGTVDIKLMIATQPNYPLAFTVNGVFAEEEMEGDDADGIRNKVEIWLTTGDHPHHRSPYAPDHIWR